MTPRVAVILLTYNDWDETLDCLASLARVTYPNLEIIAIDNGSTNPEVEDARAQFPAAAFIKNGKNLGYAEGNNVGLRCAIEHGVDYVLILNNDTRVEPRMVTHLVEFAECHPAAAFVGPLVYHFDEPEFIQSAGGMMARGWVARHRGQNEKDAGQYPAPAEMEWVTGCAILGRVSALKNIGLLDARFFNYSEEVDWCLRARELEYQVWVVPQAKVWHKGVQRNYSPSPLVAYYSARNELLLLQKHRAGIWATGAALGRHARTITSYTLRPKWHARKKHRDAIALAVRDFLRGRFGPAPLLG